MNGWSGHQIAFKFLFGGVLGAAVCSNAMPTWAQNQPNQTRVQTAQSSQAGNTSSASSGLALEEIVVTARKRAEQLQTVPDSVQAFSTQALEARNIDGLGGVAESSSNLFMIEDQDPSTNVITVRGITTNRNQPGAVAVVVDGVTLPDSDGFKRGFLDVERVEVLKGPQGALYGKGAIGGVINIITKRPGNEFEGNIRGGVGNGDLRSVRGTISGPIIPDTALFRLSGSFREVGGYIKNTTLNQDVDFLRNYDVRGRILLNATPDLEFDFRGAHTLDRGGSAWFSYGDLLTNAPNGAVGEDLLVDPRADYLGQYRRELNDLSLKVDYSPAWGTLTSISSYNTIDKYFIGDLDNTPQALVQPAWQDLDLESWSQELRFTSPDNRSFRYIFGGYYQYVDRDYTQGIDGFDIGFLSVPPTIPTGILVPFPPITTQSKFKQWALFSQFNYDLSDKTEVSLALRYDKETRKQRTARLDKASFDLFQPKLTIKHEWAEDHMIYASVVRGFKSGGFNPPPENFPLRQVDFNLVVDAEKTTSVEVGSKNEFSGGRFRLNAAAFYTDYDGLQIFQFDPFAQQVTINAENTEIYGAEVEAVAVVADGLTVDGSFGYTHSRFKNFDGTGNNDGNVPPNTPEYTANLGIEYSTLLSRLGMSPDGSDIGLTMRFDIRRVGDFYWSADNALFTPGYTSMDARASLNWRDIEMSFWVRNLSNERWAVGGFERTTAPLILGTLSQDNYTVNTPRQFGFEIRVDF